MSHHVEPVSVMYIGGVGRSGTTIFELSLGVDSRVVALGEVIHLWQRCLIDDEPCGCGRPFSRCPFWQRIGDTAFGGWDCVDAERMVALKRRIDRTVRTPQLGLGVGSARWKSEVREYASHYARIYRAAALNTGRSVVIDSSKQASLPWVLRHADDINLRVLHCVRDSRAVAYSWTKTVQRPESESGDSALMVRYRPGILALKWVQHNAVIDALRLRGMPTARVRYEDWVVDSIGCLRRAMSFAGLRPSLSDRIDSQGVDLPEMHTCSGNPLRFTQGRIDIRPDVQWKTSLPLKSRLLVTAVTAPMMAAYGYGQKPLRARPDPYK